MKNPDILYFFGKITVYPSYDTITRDLIYHFLWKHFGDGEELVRPWPDQAILPDSNPDLMNLVLKDKDLVEDYKLLKGAARLRGVNIPPNVTAYISATPQMLMFGTAVIITSCNLRSRPSGPALCVLYRKVICISM